MRAIGDINAETFFPSDDEMPAVYWDGRGEQFMVTSTNLLAQPKIGGQG